MANSIAVESPKAGLKTKQLEILKPDHCFGISVALLSTHSHVPLRCLQVSVNRREVLNGLPSAVVPVSVVIPVTIALSGPAVLTDIPRAFTDL